MRVDTSRRPERPERPERPVLRVRGAFADVLGSPDTAIRMAHTVRPVQAMLRGIVPAFFGRLLQLPLDEPLEFEYGDKRITIIIEDLPDAD